jgi:hypothetical protein
MSSKYCCGFCGVKGHIISNCNNPIGNIVLDQMRATGIYYLNDNNLRLSHRASKFNGYLMRQSNKELRIILAKINLSTNGNKNQLSARIVTYYFYDVLLNEGNYFMTSEDNLNKDEFRKYWWHISIGLDNETALRELQNYFEAIYNLSLLSEIQYQELSTEPKKFSIQVIMDSNDSISENHIHDKFECCICIEECPISNKVDINCKHSFCNNCVIGIMNQSQLKNSHPCCALCRTEFTTIHVKMTKYLKDINERFCIA